MINHPNRSKSRPTGESKKNSRSKLHEWMNGTQIYVWEAGTATFRRNECIVFADGLGYREGSGYRSIDALFAALRRFQIDHSNPTPATTAALEAVRVAIGRIEALSEAEQMMAIPNEILPACRTVWL